METALLLALGTGVVLALGDVLSEQTKTAARVRPPKPATR
jgi:urease accessory protein UreE